MAILELKTIETALSEYLIDKVCTADEQLYVEPFPYSPDKLVDLVHKDNLVLVSFENLVRILENQSYQQGKRGSINAYNKRGCAVARWSISFKLWFSSTSYYYRSCILDNLDFIVDALEGACIVEDDRLSPASIYEIKKEEIKPDEAYDNCLYYHTVMVNFYLTTTGKIPFKK